MKNYNAMIALAKCCKITFWFSEFLEFFEHHELLPFITLLIDVLSWPLGGVAHLLLTFQTD